MPSDCDRLLQTGTAEEFLPNRNKTETTRLKEPNTKEKVQEIATNQNMPSSAKHKYMLIKKNKSQHRLSLIPEIHAM